ncbi:MAG TPA: polysaccharide deacetylase family protein [Geomonas sp.]|nr:polysaccharide deacetylase family protein [Geomonas sp.]
MSYTIRLLKLLISICCYLVDSFRRMFGLPCRSGPTILYYHSVSAGEVARFRAQMDVLSRLAKPVALRDLLPVGDDARLVSVTFDDGFANLLSNVFPELSRLGIPATFFVVSGFLGQRPGWVEGWESDAGECLLDQEQLRELAASGLITIGSHTVNHPHLTNVSPAVAETEIRQSKADLESILQRKVDYLSFPYGSFSSVHVVLAKKAGYREVLAAQGPCANAAAECYQAVKRIRVDPFNWPIEFRLKVLGAYRWLHTAASAKRRMKMFGAGCDMKTGSGLSPQ